MPTISPFPSTHFSLAQHFLIATPDMDDPRFQHSVIYIWEHTQEGAAGLCINQRGPTTLAGLMRQVNLPLARADLQHVDVGWGGPLHPEQGFILHTTIPYVADLSQHVTDNSSASAAVHTDTPSAASVSATVTDAATAATAEAASSASPGFQYQSTLHLPDGLQLTTSRDLLADLYANTGPRYLLPVLGYAAWDAGQLESELRTSCWLITKAHPDIIFHTPVHQRYARACALLGIHNIALLAPGGRG